MENKMYSLHITYKDKGKEREHNIDNLTYDQAKTKLNELRTDGYELIPMFTFGGPVEKGDVFLYAIKK